MNINELMQGIFANLNLPKQNTGDENGENGLPFAMDKDFLNNMIKNMNLNEMFEKMQTGSINETSTINKNKEQDLSAPSDGKKDDDGKDDDKKKDEKLEGTYNGLKMDENIKNINFSELGMGEMDLGNLDINNLLSVFNFKNMGASEDNTSKKENIDEEFVEYLN